jgi:Cdc6-like AAA superfamily ATPase
MAKKKNIPKIFFAYESPLKSKTPDNADAIKKAIDITNQGRQYQASSWENLRNNGRILINSIFEEIDKCDIFACDLSFMNHNVLFEFGYAIAKNKKLFLLLNPNLSGAVTNFKNMEMLSTIGYSSFSNADDILNNYQKIPNTPHLLSDLTLNKKDFPVMHDIFYISNTSQSQTELDVSRLLQETAFQVQFDANSETEYRPLAGYFELIYSANNLIVHVTNTLVHTSFELNAKSSFLAGFGCGTKNIKKVLLIAPEPYDPPVDYRDIIIRYENANDCVQKLSNWLENNIQPIKKSGFQCKDKGLDILKLGLGYDIAENEKNELGKYFIETNAYEYAENERRLFFVGKKGTGKTAIYIMLGNKLLKDTKNYVIQLKPEASELISNVEVSEIYTSIAAESSFFYAIWKFVIFSKMIIEVSARLTDNHFLLEDDSVENRIIEFTQSNKDVLSKHFLEVMKLFPDTSANTLNSMYSKYINVMVNLLRKFFENTKYYEVAIIADNLDKTWDVKNDLRIQSSMLLTLLEISGHIERELTHNVKTEVNVKVVLFLRKDIFDYLLKQAREPDKLILQKYEVDWSKYPEQLKKLVEKRFSYVLALPEKKIFTVWESYFALKLEKDKTVFDRITCACLLRPRDILMFMKNMFVSAANNDREKVTEADFEYAFEEYSNFLYHNIKAELKSEYPKIENALEFFKKQQCDSFKLPKLLRDFGVLPNIELLFDLLITNEFLVLKNEENGNTYNDFQSANKDFKKTRITLWGFSIPFKKCNIYVHISTKYFGMLQHLKS